MKSAAEAVAAMHGLGPPVVVKPLTGRQGNGITIGVETDAEMQQAYDDTQLATAASQLPGAAAGLPPPPKNNQDMNGILSNSDYYNRELMNHCGPPK